MSVSASNNQDLFYMAIKTAFDNWTAYQASELNKLIKIEF